jgi:hypothetical protein
MTHNQQASWVGASWPDMRLLWTYTKQAEGGKQKAESVDDEVL